MPLRSKYSINDWILSQDHVEIGDIIAFYDSNDQKEIHAEVMQLPPEYNKQCLICKRLGENYLEVINFYEIVAYKISRRVENKLCTCGAKHTSFPNKHLDWCDLKRG